MSTIENDKIIDESTCTEPERKEEKNATEEEEDLSKLLLPDVQNLPLIPPSAVETNFITYFALGNSINPNIQTVITFSPINPKP